MDFQLIKKYVNPTHVLDIGANVGSFYRQALEAWPEAKFWLIEGNDECAAQLDSILRPGDCLDIALLSDTEKEVTFYTMRDCPTATGASYYKENTSFFHNAIETKRRTTTLDSLVWQTEFVRAGSLLIKTDCQGADLDVLKGGEFAVKSADAIICEVSHQYRPGGAPGYYNEGATNDGAAVNRFMADHGFMYAENLETIVHPLDRDRIIQNDILYLKIKGYGG